MSSSANSKPRRRRSKQTTPEAREQQLISMAYDRAEEHLQKGTASQQLITHFLKLGSTREQHEMSLLSNKSKLVEAQVENLEAQRRSDDMYEQALRALRRYTGDSDDDQNVF